MSFHPAPRIQSAKSRPNLQSTSSVLDKQYQSSGVGIFDPIQLKNRNLCSQIDMGQERDYEVKAREREGWAMDKSNQQQRTKDHLYSDIFHVKYGEAAKAADRGLARNRQPEDLQLKLQGNEYELDNANNPRQKGAFKESYDNVLTHHQKGKPADPSYYSKLSVKSIKDSVLKSKMNQPVETVIPDPRFRMFKHRRKQYMTSAQTQTAPTLETYDLKGISPEIDIIKLKKELTRTGVQVCDVNIKEELCSQARSGNGELKIRSSGPIDDLKVRRKLNSLGINSEQKASVRGKQTQFNDLFTKGWSNGFLEGKDQALKAKYGRSDAKGKRQVELSSKATLFGSGYY